MSLSVSSIGECVCLPPLSLSISLSLSLSLTHTHTHCCLSACLSLAHTHIQFNAHLGSTAGTIWPPANAQSVNSVIYSVSVWPGHRFPGAVGSWGGSPLQPCPPVKIKSGSGQPFDGSAPHQGRRLMRKLIVRRVETHWSWWSS